MDVLFIHPNFPGQFLKLAARLAREPGYAVWALGDASQIQANPVLPGVNLLSYPESPAAGDGTHAFIRSFDAAVRRGEEAVRVLLREKHKGFDPQVIYVHPGWGDGLFLKDLFPNATIIGLLEFFYNSWDSDVGFDPEFPLALKDIFRIRLLNTIQLHAMYGCDLHLSPTTWQRSRYPAEFQSRIQVLHEGVDLAAVKPNPLAELTLGNGTTLRGGDEVLTYVSRGLEPYRGFHSFMRALPAIMRARPHCQVVIVGNDKHYYGRAAPGGQTWREVYLRETGEQLDLGRVHFTGTLPYEDYLKVLQISRMHIYFTYPFVLSWSMLEAMATGCLLLGSDTEPVREVVQHGHNGLLVDFFDTKALADTAVQALSDPDPYLPLRENARATIRAKYDFNEVIYPRHLAILAGLKNH